MWRALLILISLVNASLIVQGGDPTEPPSGMGSKGSTNLRATGIELNVQSNIREGDSILIEGKIWNQYSAVDSNVEIVVQRWDGSSWYEVDEGGYNYSFEEDENKTFTYIWQAEPGRYRFTVVADPENEIGEDDESDNEESTELNVPSWATIYGDVTVSKVLGSGGSAFYSWTVPNDGTVIFYDADAGDVNVKKLEAMTTVEELEKADEALDMVGNPDCIQCRYDEDGDGEVDNWHMFQVAGRELNTPIFQVGGWQLGILWESEDGSQGFSGDEPIVFITEVQDDHSCPYSETCDYVAEVPSPLKKQFGAQDEIIIRYLE